jgi:CBS domain-containing protein
LELEGSLKDTRGLREENKRSALKAISWRLIATTTGMSIVYISTGKLELIAFFAVADIILKMLFYFMHERIWNKISFGRTFSFNLDSVMRTPPITTLPLESVSTVVHKMVSSNIGAVVVVENGKSMGLITEKDVLTRVLETGRDTFETYAQDIMSSPVIFVEDKMSPKDILQMMRAKNIRRLAVTKKGELVGIISERRILNALL